jgi:membrane fusion protein, heavy metal efflux system
MRRAAPRLIIAGLFGIAAACGKGDEKTVPPAKVEGAKKESEIATLTLTPEAEQRLGLTFAAVERRSVTAVRMVGGIVEAPPGRNLPLTAPLAGTVLAPESGAVPAAGTRVGRGQVLFRVASLPPADRELQADKAREEVKASAARLEAARAAAARARKLTEIGAGSVKAEQEAVSQREQAEAALEGARSRLAFLTNPDLDSAARTKAALRVEAPRDGVLMDVTAAPGSTVMAGAMLGQVVSDDVLWVRVPLFSGDLAVIARGAEAAVSRLGDASRTWPAMELNVPPRADAAAATTEVVYALGGAVRDLRPGERVMVAVPRASVEEALVAPWSAVVYDVEGGTWVYAVEKPHVYARRRVEVRHVTGGLAVLARGPEPGTQVVTAGAAELFGTEFGAK